MPSASEYYPRSVRIPNGRTYQTGSTAAKAGAGGSATATWPQRATAEDSGSYRFTVRILALLLPAAVVTVTLTAPYLAFAGTANLTCVSLQET